jgi:hypothetical protein
MYWVIGAVIGGVAVLGGVSFVVYKFWWLRRRSQQAHEVVVNWMDEDAVDARGADHLDDDFGPAIN